MKIFIALSFLILSCFTMAQKVLTPELMWKLKRVNGGSISSDGRYVLFEVKSYEMETNKGNNEIFVYDIKKDKVKQLTTTPFSEMEAQWGKNNSIWFLSKETDGLQIWKMNLEGEDKMKMSSFVDIELEGFKIAPNEKSIITIQAVKTRKTLQEKYPDLALSNARIEEDLMYKHWDHYDDFKKRHLFVHSIENDAIELNGTDILKGENFD